MSSFMEFIQFRQYSQFVCSKFMLNSPPVCRVQFRLLSSFLKVPIKKAFQFLRDIVQTAFPFLFLFCFNKFSSTISHPNIYFYNTFHITLSLYFQPQISTTTKDAGSSVVSSTVDPAYHDLKRTKIKSEKDPYSQPPHHTHHTPLGQ